MLLCDSVAIVFAADHVEIGVDIVEGRDEIADIVGGSLLGRQGLVHEFHMRLVDVIHAGRALRPGGEGPIDHRLDDDVGDADEIGKLPDAARIDDGVGDDHHLLGGAGQLDPAPFGAEQNRIAGRVGQRDMDRRHIRFQRAEGADLAAGKRIDHAGDFGLVRVVIRREGAAILHVRADVDGGGNEGPIQRAAEQTQRHDEIGVILQRQLAALHRAAQAIGEAEHFQRRKSAFRLGDGAGRSEQIELLAIAVKNGVKVRAVVGAKVRGRK